MPTSKIVWIKTNHRGLRYYEHPTRLHGKRKDRYYSIRFKVDGKEHGYGIGWVSTECRKKFATRNVISGSKSIA